MKLKSLFVTATLALVPFLGAALPAPAKAASMLASSSPWVTTAIYIERHGKMDASRNYILESTGQNLHVIGAATYAHGSYIFVPVNVRTGAFNLQSHALLDNYGWFRMEMTAGRLIRNIYKSHKNYVQKREVVTLTPNLFTYRFQSKGVTYYVQHRRYSAVYPKRAYPAELASRVKKLLSGL